MGNSSTDNEEGRGPPSLAGSGIDRTAAVVHDAGYHRRALEQRLTLHSLSLTLFLCLYLSFFLNKTICLCLKCFLYVFQHVFTRHTRKKINEIIWNFFFFKFYSILLFFLFA